MLHNKITIQLLAVLKLIIIHLIQIFQIPPLNRFIIPINLLVDLKLELVMIKVKQEIEVSQINCLLNLNYYQEDLLILKLKMIAKVERLHLLILINLLTLINHLSFYLEQVLTMLVLQIIELLINQYQEFKQQELEGEMVMVQFLASKVKNLLNLLLQKVYQLHFLILVLLSEVFLIFFQNLILLASFLIVTAFQKIHLSMVANHLAQSIFFQLELFKYYSLLSFLLQQPQVQDFFLLPTIGWFF